MDEAISVEGEMEEKEDSGDVDDADENDVDSDDEDDVDDSDDGDVDSDDEGVVCGETDEVDMSLGDGVVEMEVDCEVLSETTYVDESCLVVVEL